MKNSELIETLTTSEWMCLKGDSVKFKKAIALSVANACENDKLKVEIEQLKIEVKSLKVCSLEEEIKELKGIIETRKYIFEKQTDNLLKENEKLKAELEQSVKLPCKVGDSVTAKVNRPYNGHDVTINGTITDIQTVIRVADSFDRHVDFLVSDFGETVFLTREESLEGE